MEKIINFKLNQNADGYENILRVLDIINQFIKSSETKRVVKELSTITNLPQEVIEMKFQQLIFKKFDYSRSKPKFNLSFNLFECMKYLLYFFIFIFFALFPKAKKIRIKKDIILDNVDSLKVVKKFNKLLLYFSSPLIIVKINQFMTKFSKILHFMM